MQKMNKKLIKLLIFEIAAIAAIIYFTQTSWNTTRSTSGHLSKETYLNGGTGTEEIKKDYRLYYECVIGSGTMCIEIREEDDNIVKRKVISETENGYIYFDDLESGTYSETEYALTDDTDAYFSVSIQKKVNNLQRTINWIFFIS